MCYGCFKTFTLRVVDVSAGGIYIFIGGVYNFLMFELRALLSKAADHIEQMEVLWALYHDDGVLY